MAQGTTLSPREQALGTKAFRHRQRRSAIRTEFHGAHGNRILFRCPLHRNFLGKVTNSKQLSHRSMRGTNGFECRSPGRVIFPKEVLAPNRNGMSVQAAPSGRLTAQPLSSSTGGRLRLCLTALRRPSNRRTSVFQPLRQTQGASQNREDRHVFVAICRPFARNHAPQGKNFHRDRFQFAPYRDFPLKFE